MIAFRPTYWRDELQYQVLKVTDWLRDRSAAPRFVMFLRDGNYMFPLSWNYDENGRLAVERLQQQCTAYDPSALIVMQHDRQWGTQVAPGTILAGVAWRNAVEERHAIAEAYTLAPRRAALIRSVGVSVDPVEEILAAFPMRASTAIEQQEARERLDIDMCRPAREVVADVQLETADFDHVLEGPDRC